MAVDLSDYTDDFLDEINPPGVNNFPTLSSDEMIRRLVAGFWELRLSGLDFLAGWDCSAEGLIVPNGRSSGFGFNIPPEWYTDDGSPDLGREVVQAIILFAGYRVALTAAQNLNTALRTSAGPVSYEIEKSARLQQEVLKGLVDKIHIVLTRLSDLGTTSVLVVDQVMEKTTSQYEGYTWWAR